MAALTARGLGLRTRRGWVFRDVDLDVSEGDVVALTGPAHSGRTSLLLALTGYFATSTGTLTRSVPAALGLVPGAHDPEPGLTVAEHARERLLLYGRKAGRAEVARVLGDCPGSPRALGRDLTPYQRHRLMLALAAVGEPGLIGVDDADLGLSTVERTELWAVLGDLAERGHAVLATCRELDDGVKALEWRIG
jgi:ABC-2 type transport system ATP-binding protein